MPLDPKLALARTVSGDELTVEGMSRTAETGPPRDPAGDETPELRGERLERRLAAVGLAWRGDEGGKRFALGSLLGAGATGRVFTVHDADLDRDVAVKVLTGDASRRPSDIDAFIDEARITAGLTHPHVVPVHEIDVTAGGSPYFTMSKVAGRTLGDAIAQSSPASPDGKIADSNRVVSALIAVGHAVSYAHHRGIIHQDIKPDNILLGDFGEVLLLDWGSAARWPASDAKLYGTPIYMSPEQARRESSTPSSDVYCLGATLFHALTLRVPTWSDDADEFWRRKRSGEIDPPTEAERSRVRPALFAIAIKAMAVRPADRYGSVEDLVHDLERYQAGLAVSAFSEPLWNLLARWYSANRRVVWVALAAVLVVAFLGGAFWNEKRKERSQWASVYRDGFASGEIAAVEKDWTASTKGWHDDRFTDQPLETSTHWRLEGGRLLVKAEEGYYDLAFRRRLRGDVRIEWDYTPLRKNENLNCFIDADDRSSGYTFHIGGWGMPAFLALTRGPSAERVAERREPGLLVVGKTLHYVMEREGRHVRLSIGGKLMFDHLEFDDLQAPGGQGFGFDCCFGSEQALANIEVWHRPLAERISPIAVGTQLYQFGYFRDAAKVFDEIASSYPGTDFEPQARYRQAMSQITAGDIAAGTTGLRDFVGRFPAHQDAPLALRTWETLALDAGSEADASAADDRLLAFSGHPVLPLLFKDIADRRRKRLEGVDWLGGSRPPDDAADIIVKTEGELHAWCRKHGLAYADQSFSELAYNTLLRAGNTRLMLELYAADPSRHADTLMRQGRFDECERLYGTDHNARLRLLIARGQIEDALKEAGISWERESLFVELDQPERLLETDPEDRSLQCRALLECGRPQAVIDGYPDQRGWYASALISLGRQQEALDRYQDVMKDFTGAYMDALIATGRLDEVMGVIMRTTADGRESFVWRLMIEYLVRGERASAMELMAKLTPLQPRFDDSTLAFCHVMLPVIMRVLDGERVDLHEGFRPVLEHRDVLEQRLWHDASFLSGDIDEAAYLAQPVRHHVETRLAFVTALRADLQGRADEAAAAYARILAPKKARGLDQILRRLMAWRAGVLGAQPAP